MKPERTGAESGAQTLKSGSGFTLLEVLISLVILAVGATVAMSVISSSLGNVRKVQIRMRVMGYAQNIMESALYREDLQQPTSYSEDLGNGFRYMVLVDEYRPELDTQSDTELPIKLLQYKVEMIGPDSPDPVYEIQTLKLVDTSEETQSPTR